MTTETLPSATLYNEMQQPRKLFQKLCDFYSLLNEPVHEFFQPLINLADIYEDYDKGHKLVFNELKDWQQQQCRNRNQNVGISQEDNLNLIQNCIGILFRITFRLLEIIDDVRTGRIQVVSYEKLEQLERKIRIKQNNILTDSFVVDNQPNEIIKTAVKLSPAPSVRWLIGIQLGSNCTISKVECEVATEERADIPTNQERIPYFELLSRAILNNEVEMNYQEQNHMYYAEFRELQVRRSKRSECTSEEKYALLFHMTVKIDNAPLRIWTLSQPFVVIEHSNQERQAKATMMWDAAFSEVCRKQFEVPKTVTWKELSRALNVHCISEVKRGLKCQHYAFLYAKLFPNCDILPEAPVSWEQFCKVCLNGHNFTFWEWFDGTLQLIKEHLLILWQSYLIEGFISKTTAKEKLESEKPGTFLLRFSDSIAGALTIAFVKNNNIVQHIAPWTLKDLNEHCLLDRLRDLQFLEQLYPFNITKNRLISIGINVKNGQKLNKAC